MRRAAFVLAAFLVAAPAEGQEPPTLTVSGMVQHPLTLTAADLRAMPAIDVTVSQQTDRGPASGKFRGVLLRLVLDTAGLANGPEKNAPIRHTILVIGKDGYAAAISEGEIDPKLEGKQVILATQKDGQPLNMPQLVVPGDAHASRGVHDVVSIVVQ